MGLPSGQLLHDVLPGDLLLGHDDHQMIEIVGDLVDDLVGIGILGRDDDLGILLSQLLEHLVQALVEEVVGIGAFLWILSSFQDGLVSPPVYTRPRNYKGWEVPEVLLSGNDKLISDWRLEKAIERTKERRPEMYENFKKS